VRPSFPPSPLGDLIPGDAEDYRSDDGTTDSNHGFVGQQVNERVGGGEAHKPFQPASSFRSKVLVEHQVGMVPYPGPQQLSRRRYPWFSRRTTVTVCIAALCERGKQIVSVSDSKISFDAYSADDAIVKSVPIAPGWRALFAGSDIIEAQAIINAASSALSENAIYDPRTVKESVYVAYYDRLHRQIEATILMQYGMTLNEFVGHGKDRFTDREHEALFDKIASVSLSSELILAGFDAEGDGHIILINGDGPPKEYDSVGFCCIGSGANMAYGMLLYQANKNHLGADGELGECIYCCCEAKFMSESASEVGRETFLSVFRAGEPPSFILSTRIDEIRTAWEKYGAPKIPPAILKTIPDMLFTRDQWMNHKTQSDVDRILGKVRRNDRRSSRFRREFKGLKRLDLQEPTRAKTRYPQSPTTDQSRRQPSPESPGESDES
jgi:hypothetical protein